MGKNNLVRMIALFQIILFTVTSISCMQENASDFYNRKYSIHNDIPLNSDDFKSEQIPTIFINQSNNIHIVAKYGQTVNLPCVIYKLKNQDLSQIHAVWNKLVDKQRPIVLSIGSQQLKQDMRYRVKQIHMNNEAAHVNREPLEYTSEKSSIHDLEEKTNDYSIENWQFEIRKLIFEDSGTYQCLLSLVKPIIRNITLKIIPEITVEPKEASFSANERIAINCKAHVKLHHHSHKNIDGKNQRHQKQVLNWYKDDEPIKNYYNPNSKHKIEITNSQNNDNHSLSSILIIHNSREEDSGKYVCVYDNYSEQTKVQVLNEANQRNFMMSNFNDANTSVRSNYMVFILVAFNFVFLIML